MALEKEIISANGTVETYHRISSITNNHGIVEVTIISYVDEAHREMEIDILTKQKRQLYLGELIGKMCEVPPEERSAKYEAEIQALMAEQATYGPEIWQAGQLYSSEHFYELDMSSYADISFEDIYNELAKLDDFNGSSTVEIESPYKFEERIKALEEKKPALLSAYTDNASPTGIAERYYEIGEILAVYDNNNLPITVIVTMPISYNQTIALGLNCERYYGG